MVFLEANNPYFHWIITDKDVKKIFDEIQKSFNKNNLENPGSRTL